MAPAWLSHGLALCPGNPSPVTPSALQSLGQRMMCSSLHDATALALPSEAERGNPVPLNVCAWGQPVPKAHQIPSPQGE